MKTLHCLFSYLVLQLLVLLLVTAWLCLKLLEVGSVDPVVSEGRRVGLGGGLALAGVDLGGGVSVGGGCWTWGWAYCS